MKSKLVALLPKRTKPANRNEGTHISLQSQLLPSVNQYSKDKSSKETKLLDLRRWCACLFLAQLSFWTFGRAWIINAVCIHWMMWDPRSKEYSLRMTALELEKGFWTSSSSVLCTYHDTGTKKNDLHFGHLTNYW